MEGGWQPDVMPRRVCIPFIPDIETLQYTKSGAKRMAAISAGLPGCIPKGVQGIIWEYAHGTWIYYFYTLICLPGPTPIWTVGAGGSSSRFSWVSPGKSAPGKRAVVGSVVLSCNDWFV